MQKIEFHKLSKQEQIEYAKKKMYDAFYSFEFDQFCKLQDEIKYFEKTDWNIQNNNDYKNYIRIVELLFPR